MRRKTLLARYPGVTIALGVGFATVLALTAPAFADGRIFSTSDSISQAQAILQHEGYLERDSYKNGEADTATIRAIKAFQAMHMRVATGWLDAETMAELLSHAGPFDSDRDSVADNLDQCPDTPVGTRVDSLGCPRDMDNDTVADRLDRCSDTPFGARADADGCPMDNDRDAVYDGLDRCAYTVIGAMVDSDGCPIDSDRDLVFDGIDRCPGTAQGTAVDTQGCPEETQPVAVYEERESFILEGVRFEPNTATLTPESKAVLDRAAEMLIARPGTEFEIAGYTDDTNTNAYNLRLSQRRAETVRRYLVAHGVEGSRLVARGYGESRPVADNDTPGGRAQNRRVEIAQID